MSGVRVLVGTRKGAFILTSDGKRKEWDVSGPHFAGWEIYHVKGSPVDPNRIYASQTSAWFGQIIQRSDDGGKTGMQPGTAEASRQRRPKACRKARATSSSTTRRETGNRSHPQWYDGTQHPWEFKRVWHLEPSLTDPRHVYAGVEDAALFDRPTAGSRGTNCPVCASMARDRNGSRAPAACVCTPSCSIRKIPTESSSPSPRRARFAPTMAARLGSRSIEVCTRNTFPTRTRKSATVFITSRCILSRPNTLFMQKHWDVMRSDDAGDSWREVSGNLADRLRFPDRRSCA